MSVRSFFPAVLLAAVLWAGCATSRPTQPTAPATPVVTATPTSTVEAVPAAPPTDEPPLDWFTRDAAEDGLRGVSADRAYATLLQGRAPARTVVVAVIDGGVDVQHEDLRGKIWVNPDEVAGNGVDDDGNGYVDDVHGWNFIGGPDGRNVHWDTFELTREVARYQTRFEHTDPATLSGQDRQDYDYYRTLKDELAEKLRTSKEMQQTVGGIAAALREVLPKLQQALGKTDLAEADLENVDESQDDLAQAAGILRFLFANDITPDQLFDYEQQLEADIKYRYNLQFDPRTVVGDNPTDLSQRFYGNPDVTGPDAKHGTHVAGIIAADRDNGQGAEGIATPVQIMAIRAVPNGDERDKDVANAIRYAADNGAHIINMSFGKAYSPQKQAVDEAVRYAEARGVLLVHAAGNDSKNVDAEPNYPSDRFLDGQTVTNWVSVGASGWQAGDGFAASFSNYGQTQVDLFAPGVQIYSTLPGSTYGPNQGTSMAAPMVSGVVALVWAYYPHLTAAQLKDVLLRSAVRYTDETVVQPGTEDQEVPFNTLSVTGGVVNAYEALRLAASMGQ